MYNYMPHCSIVLIHVVYLFPLSFVHQRINPYIARWFLLGFGFNWITVSGAPAPSTEAPIFVVAPHTSMLDVFVLMIFGVPTFVARGESQNVPFFGSKINLTRYSSLHIYILQFIRAQSRSVVMSIFSF